MDETFKSKVVIVTGGTSGIGRELVRQLAGMGAVVYIAARNSIPGEALQTELRAKGYNATFRAADMQSAESVEALVNFVLQQEGRIDYLFHCAGIILGGEIRDHQLADIQNVLTTNVLGTAYMSFYTYRVMARQGSGHIVNLGSAAGLFPVPLMGVYSASKFAVYGLGEALRLEGKGLGVRVSTVAPGIVDTPIYDTGVYSKTDKERSKKLVRNRASAITPQKAARVILSGTRRNQAVIFTHLYGRLGWLSYRYAPWAFRFFMARYMGPYRKTLRNNQADDPESASR